MQSMFLEPVTCVFLKVVHDPKRKRKTTTLRLPYHHRRRQVGFQIFLHLISEKEKKLNATQIPPCLTTDSAWKRYGNEHLIRENLGKKGLPIESFQNTHWHEGCFETGKLQSSHINCQLRVPVRRRPKMLLAKKLLTLT